MMEADAKGMEMLKSMDIVGVGGAALPVEVGDRLVRNNVNLISRFGSAECGFLLSSHRHFLKDKEWQYLRNYNPEELLSFETRDDGLSELVVRPAWPHLAKTNHDDGSFATADLFERHSKVENAWFYHSRADSQLTLITGKKFDPAPLEAATATAQQLDDVLIFGNQRPYPGALLLRSQTSSDMSDSELVDSIWPRIDKLNEESQDHARIPRHMLIPIRHQNDPLEKSSKGTTIRKVAEARFASYIDAAYDSNEDQESQKIDDERLPHYLASVVQSIVQNSDPPAEDTDLFSYGIDSIASMRLRSRLRQLTPNYNQELPLSIVEDCGTIRDLSKYIIRKRHGEPDANTEDQKQLMLDLVKDYSDFRGHVSSLHRRNDVNGRSGEVMVLTGATGALGAHILDLLRKSDVVTTIYCLVRGADETAARGRVSKALEQRGLPDLSSQGKHNNKIKVVQAQLGEPRLGLPDKTYNYLAREADAILHIAWNVNFRLNLRSFAKDNLAGVKNLIDLALAAERSQPARFAYCSSTAAIISGEVDSLGCLPERVSNDPSSASPLGYSRSKWVAEHLCLAAYDHTPLKDRISVIRVGQLSGDSTSGIWNTKEAWPMMLSTARLIGCLPDLGDEPLDWLPVDIAAEAFLQAAQSPDGESDMLVFHVLNPHERPTWGEMLQWLKKREDFEVVTPKEWVKRLEECENEGHSAMKLLGLWKDAYCNGDSDKDRKTHTRLKFSVEETKRRVTAMRNVRPVDEAYMVKIWDWVQENVH
ncbi:hypothetical protein N0V90_003262 [Kalmusia sp. IMI 367209]|nr:hypothetical protein N0V90_003262 [Kalmusia sp. IMI 367209]